MTAPRYITSYEPDIHHAFGVALATGEHRILCISVKAARSARSRIYSYLSALRRTGAPDNIALADRFGAIMMQVEGREVIMRKKDEFGFGLALRQSLEARGEVALPDWVKRLEGGGKPTQEDVLDKMMKGYLPSSTDSDNPVE